MSIYDKDGTGLITAYDISGATINKGYDVNGNIVFDPVPLGIKVMSYNVGGWYIGSGANVPSNMDAQYYALQNGMLSNDDPDILCLQEYWNTFSQAGRTAVSMLSNYFPYIEARNGNSTYFGRAICSKYPITNYVQHSFANESDRYYDSCTVTINGVDYTVITTHFGLTLAKRTAQISELLSFISSLDNIILCGDFNTVDCLDLSGDDYISIVKPIINSGYNVANCSGGVSTFYVTYSERPNNTDNDLVLDNIVTSPNLRIRSVSVDTTKLTDGINAKVDHMPIIATL